jgi:hypothetical protein
MQILQFDMMQSRQGNRLEALQFRSDNRALAGVWRTQQNIIDVCWWDVQRGVVSDSSFGASLGEDDATPPIPALSADQRFLALMQNERGGAQSLAFIDRDAKGKGKGRRELTAWEYDEDDYSLQYFIALAISPNGEHLFAAVGGGDPEDDAIDAHRIGIFRWSVKTILGGRGTKSRGRLLPDKKFFLQTPQPDVSDWARFGRPFVISPDGHSLAAGFWDNHFRIWELASGHARPEPKLKKRKYATAWRLAFSPDGRTLAVADENVALYDVESAKPLLALPPGPKFQHESLGKRPIVFDVAFDPSGKLFATANGDAPVRWYDAKTGAERATFDWGIGSITAVAFSPDGSLCAAGGEGGQVAVWDVV